MTAHNVLCSARRWPRSLSKAWIDGATSTRDYLTPRRATAGPSRPQSLHSSSTSRFIWFEPPATRPAPELRRRIRALEPRQAGQLLKLYPDLLKARESDPRIELTHRDLRKVMRLLGSPGRPGPELHLLEDVFHQLIPVWGIAPVTEDYALVFRGLVNSGRWEAAIRWLNAAEAEGVPGGALIAAVVEAQVDAGRVAEAFGLVEMMQGQGIDVDERIIGLLLRGAFQISDSVRADWCHRQMQKRELAPGVTFYGALLLSPNETQVAESVRRLRQLMLSGTVLDKATQCALLRIVGVREGWAEATTLLQRLRPDPKEPLEARLLCTLAEVIPLPTDSVDATDSLQTLTDLAGHDAALIAPSSAAIILRRILANPSRGYSLRTALAWADAQGKEVSAAARVPIFEAAARDGDLDTLKMLWAQMEAANVASSSDPNGRRAVLTAAIQSGDDELALDVLKDMKTRNLTLSSADLEVLADLVVRAKWTRSCVFPVYEAIVRLEPRALTRRFFNVFLDGLLHRYLRPAEYRVEGEDRYEDRRPLSMTQLMAVLTDMRAARTPADSATYRNLLHHYADVVRLSGNPCASLPQVERLHAMIRLEKNFDPDAALLNALLKAYSYHGEWRRGWAVWDLLQSRMGGAITNTAVANTLDMAGYEAAALEAGQLDRRATKLWQAVGKDRFPMVRKNDKNLWDTWVEALARAGLFEEAQRVILEQMESNGGRRGAPIADATTLRVLLRLARSKAEADAAYAKRGASRFGGWRKLDSETGPSILDQNNIFTELREALRTRLPDVWASVEAEGLTPREAAVLGLTVAESPHSCGQQ